MKKYFDQLRPMERRLVVGVGVTLLVVLNWLFVWPHFGDWSKLNLRLNNAEITLKNYQAMIAQKPALEKQVTSIQNDSGYVPQEDQGINFIRTIQSQAIQSGVAIVNTSRQATHTNDAFFIEQVQNITVSATDEQLVDFLYKLGSGASMVRVSDLELQPDQSHMRLAANIKLVASYQKTPAVKPAAPAPKPATTAATLGLKPTLPAMNLSNAKPK
jgi:type II secretory pathway component PulM